VMTELHDDVRLVRVPGGQLSMGSKDGEDDERPVHTVTVQPFDIDVTEVAVAKFRACVDSGRCSAPVKGESCNWGVPDRDQHPINCVDWSQADTYCKALGKRLPTEEEWEYAARGDQKRKFPWGATAPSNQPCWNGEGNTAGKGKRESTCAVGSLATDKSSFGVLDMAANVSEWTASHYCPYPIANCASPLRAVRGATWADFSVNTLRTSYRGRSLPSERSGAIGFRCARTP
jgi:formylglycine-generating enzyme required for sulfatase activity